MGYIGVKPAGISSASQVETDVLNVDNIRLDGNTISSTDTNGDITLDPDGTGDVVVAAGHKLGIGTSSPDTSLHISAASSARLRLEDTTNNVKADILVGDTSSVIGNASNHDLAFMTNDVNRMTITSDGKVGIGCTPTTKFQVQGASNANNIEIGGDYIQSFNRSGSPGYQSLPMFASDFKLYTAGSERLRIDASGNLLLGTTANLDTASRLNVKYTYTNSGAAWESNSTATHNAIVFKNPNGNVGTIQTSGSSTAYNTSSDYRLKENVADMTGAIDRVKALAPKRFNFIADPDDTTVDGFLAHEAQAVVPEAVTGTHNETRTFTNVVLSSDGKLLAQDVAQADWTAGKLATTDVKGNAVDALYPSDSTWSSSHDGPVMQGIDQSKLVPLLTGALREAIAKIETLETSNADLIARIEALETA